LLASHRKSCKPPTDIVKALRTPGASYSENTLAYYSFIAIKSRSHWLEKALVEFDAGFAPAPHLEGSVRILASSVDDVRELEAHFKAHARALDAQLVYIEHHLALRGLAPLAAPAAAAQLSVGAQPATDDERQLLAQEAAVAALRLKVSLTALSAPPKDRTADVQEAHAVAAAASAAKVRDPARRLDRQPIIGRLAALRESGGEGIGDDDGEAEWSDS